MLLYILSQKEVSNVINNIIFPIYIFEKTDMIRKKIYTFVYVFSEKTSAKIHFRVRRFTYIVNFFIKRCTKMSLLPPLFSLSLLSFF